MKLLKSKMKCGNCEDVIESKNRHDFVTCSCFSLSACCQKELTFKEKYGPAYCSKCDKKYPGTLGIALDGGTDYCRMLGNFQEATDLSDYEEE